MVIGWETKNLADTVSSAEQYQHGSPVSYYAQPKITSSPEAAAEGQKIIITGAGFTDNSESSG